MLKFFLTTEIKGSRDVVEVRDGKELIAAIYPHENYITVVSKHLKDVELDKNFPPKALISFNRVKRHEHRRKAKAKN